MVQSNILSRAIEPKTTCAALTRVLLASHYVQSTSVLCQAHVRKVQAGEPQSASFQKNGKIPMCKRNFIFALLAVSACVIFSGCDDKKKGDGEEQHKMGSKLEKVNIGNAKYIFQYGSPSSTKSTGSGDYSFYKTDENGKIELIVFINENGDTLLYQITKIVDVNSEFLFFSGIFPTLDEKGNQVTYHHLLVNKKTEKIYALPNSFYIPYVFKISTDVSGNLYIIAGNQVYKINLVSYTIEEMPFGNNENAVSDMVIDRHGICLYRVNYSNYRLRHTSNWFKITPVDEEIRSVVLGNDGYIYFLSENDWDDYLRVSCSLYRIDEVNNDVNLTLLSKPTWYGGLYYNHTNDNLIIINGHDLNEYNIEDNSWRHVELPPKEDYYGQFISQNCFYSFNKISRKFIRLDLRTYEVSVISVSGYEIYEKTISLYSDEINFTGMRFSDSRNVVGSIDASGNVTIIIECENEQKIENLIQLN